MDRLDQVQALLAAASTAPAEMSALYMARARTKLVEVETRARELRAALEGREAELVRTSGAAT